MQASGLFTANATVPVNGTNYSIYTGTTPDGLIRIKHGGGAVNSDAVFAVGNAATNGTAGAIGAGSDAIASGKSYFGSYAVGNIEILAADAENGTLVADLSLVPLAPPRVLPLPPFPPLFPPSLSPDALRRIPFEEPDRFFPLIPYEIPIQIFKNPVTHDTYRDEGELDLTRALNDQQRGRLEDLIQRDRLKAGEFRKGKKDEDGCYSTELDRRLGDYKPHDDYAEVVTNSEYDFLMVSKDELANFAFYDGEVKIAGLATSYGQPQGRLAEVKTGGRGWIKVLNNQIDNLSSREWEDLIQTLRELKYQTEVARSCQRRNFISFSNEQAAQAAQQVFANKGTLPGVANLRSYISAKKIPFQALSATSSFDRKNASDMLLPYSELNFLIEWNAVRYIPETIDF